MDQKWGCQLRLKCSHHGVCLRVAGLNSTYSMKKQPSSMLLWSQFHWCRKVAASTCKPSANYWIWFLLDLASNYPKIRERLSQKRSLICYNIDTSKLVAHSVFPVGSPLTFYCWCKGKMKEQAWNEKEDETQHEFLSVVGKLVSEIQILLVRNELMVITIWC